MNKTTKTIIWVVVLALVIWGIVALLNQNNTSSITGDESVKLGFIGPLTGDAATLGASARAGVELAVEELNESGGINGKNVEVIYEDGKCTGSDATNAANKLINIDQVSGIIGGLCSAETSAFAPIAENSGTPVISYCASAPALTNAGDYIFRTYPSDSFQGVYAADYMKNNLEVDRVAILYTNDDWGTGLFETFKSEFEKLGGEVVITERFEKSAKDLRGQLTKIKGSDAQAIYWPGFDVASIPGIGQYRELGMEIPVLGADAWDDISIWEAVSSDGNGFMFTAVNTPEDSEFKNKMLEKIEAVTICGPQAYDSANLFIEAIKEVGNDKEDIKDNLYTVEGYEGVSGIISFDENGDLETASYNIKVANDGEVEILE